MRFIDLAERRFAAREYLDRPVETEKLEYVLQSARLAPSAVNRQPWLFYVVSSEEGRAAVQECYDREWFRQAPLYIVAVEDHSSSWTRGDGKDHADIDIAIAVEHICLSAAEQGLATCWVCNFDGRKLSEALSLDKCMEPAVIVAMGYSGMAVPEKRRKDLADIVRYL